MSKHVTPFWYIWALAWGTGEKPLDSLNHGAQVSCADLCRSFLRRPNCWSTKNQTPWHVEGLCQTPPCSVSEGPCWTRIWKRSCWRRFPCTPCKYSWCCRWPKSCLMKNCWQKAWSFIFQMTPYMLLDGLLSPNCLGTEPGKCWSSWEPVWKIKAQSAKADHYLWCSYLLLA